MYKSWHATKDLQPTAPATCSSQGWAPCVLLFYCLFVCFIGWGFLGFLSPPFYSFASVLYTLAIQIYFHVQCTCNCMFSVHVHVYTTPKLTLFSLPPSLLPPVWVVCREETTRSTPTTSLTSRRWPSDTMATETPQRTLRMSWTITTSKTTSLL